MSSTAIPKVVPAQLSFLAIYNPSLGTSDETFHDQIVFYYSKAAKARSRIEGKDEQAEKELREQENEKLRQVGLAQGMVGFARSFSNGAAVDSVDTQKSRIVLQELEEGWWVLASVDLTQLPAHPSSSTTANGTDGSGPAVEYSSKEVSPPGLLLLQLNRAHNIFLLHHGTTLDGLLHKHKRTKFCNIMETFWSRFANSWDVLLHGSPAVDIYNGMKLAAGGELGIGVGEEEWGSGERLVLEDFVHKTDGLVDLMVSRFGEPSPLQDPHYSPNSKRPVEPSDSESWIGTGGMPGAADGIVFSGVSAIKPQSLRDLSQWVESIYCYGEYAYGVRDNPTAGRTTRRRKNPRAPVFPAPPSETSKPPAQAPNKASASKRDVVPPPGIPPPIVKAAESSLKKASSAVDSTENSTEADKSDPILASLGDTETWMKYLTLGYSTGWGTKKPPADQQPSTHETPITREATPEVPMTYVEPQPDVDVAGEKLKAQIRHENTGYFLIGLKGDMDDEFVDDENDEGDWNNRTLLRTVHVELAKQSIRETFGGDEDETPVYEKEISIPSFSTPNFSNLSRLRPVVYVHRPFIYTFLFKHRTEALTVAPFYRNLHTYFSPLHRPLSNSTSPNRIAARLSVAFHPYTTTTSSSQSADLETQPIYDLVYDPRTLTIHSSIPNIPDPGTLIAEGLSSSAPMTHWSRLEALNVHSQIIATVTSTRRTLSEIERTCKTGRGWWVVWMRLPPSQHEPAKDPEAESQEFDTDQLREAFLVRRARDASVSTTKSSGSRFASGMWRPTGEKMGGAAAGWGPKGLAEGIGIDARRYVEGLLSLNR
ncbi:hypothetical protein K458DRAFT_162425 [Lentithecium fluviatile CBS 122367]|uniref:CCZ1/INTU/HSP4 first Longin domain-containing protein n=1 Tax=Lentithecium fluviatile CBS 122367 TaxID=1168545 RepID=A0A6G1IH41_9PLEO|nr:hypothetical protein K458DRAFT_162425 [Lentithecium fluviatile CBS 122367]